MLIVCTRAAPGRRIILEEGSIVYPEEGQSYRVQLADGQALIATGDFAPAGPGLEPNEAPEDEPIGVVDIAAEGSGLGTSGRVGADPDPHERETQELIPCRDC